MTADVLDEGLRRQVSAWLGVAAFGLFGALGFVQFWKDGSFWIDEASVAMSLLELTPRELFGPLIGGQSFPRPYLFAIKTLVGLLGYETMVARALPQLFFWGATAAWIRLLHLRFRDEPGLIALGALLLMVPGTWFVYAAMLKPYTLDVLLAAVPFLLRDAFYDTTLGRGEKPWRLFALTALGSLSYPFALALLARCGGWWLLRARGGNFRLSTGGLAIGVGGVALFVAVVWATDLRHTAAVGDSLRSYWSNCRIGAEGTPTLALLDRFAFGWYDGRAEFSRGARLGEAALWVSRLAFLAGFARILTGAAPAGWGSRSVGCCVLLAGLPVASWWFGYPVCAGRLTLFALLPLLLVTLEGFSLTADGLRRAPRGPWLAAGLAAMLLVWITPVSYRAAAGRVAAATPEDLRPLLARVREQPDVPILTNVCTRKQIETLPEGLPGEVFYFEKGGGIVVATRTPAEAWFLIVPAAYCQSAVKRVLASAVDVVAYHTERDTAQLFRLRFPAVSAPSAPAVRSHRREAPGTGKPPTGDDTVPPSRR